MMFNVGLHLCNSSHMVPDVNQVRHYLLRFGPDTLDVGRLEVTLFSSPYNARLAWREGN
jgi:hypothetical protein